MTVPKTEVFDDDTCLACSVAVQSNLPSGIHLWCECGMVRDRFYYRLNFPCKELGVINLNVVAGIRVMNNRRVLRQIRKVHDFFVPNPPKIFISVLGHIRWWRSSARRQDEQRAVTERLRSGFPVNVK